MLLLVHSFLILFTMVGVKLGFASVLISHIAFSVPIVVINGITEVTRNESITN